MRTLKEECLWLTEWTSPFELAKVFEAWVPRYNATYLHSTLGYKPRGQFEKEQIESHRGHYKVLNEGHYTQFETT